MTAPLPPDEVLEELSLEVERLLQGRQQVDLNGLARRFGVAPQLVEDCRAGLTALSPELRSPTGGQRVLGGYQLLGELSRGGMGAVYRARHRGLRKDVALKVLLAGAQASSRQLERFQLEARAAARLRHPNLVAIHDVGHDAGCAFLVMDLVEGETLAQRLRREGALDTRHAAEVAEAVARGLACAHAQLILHRDVKPDNILLSRDGQTLLTDFGLAKEVDAKGTALTRTGAVVGTLRYMPPEQLVGEVERRSDVYALGATLYEALTGETPFLGLDTLELAAAITDVEPRPPSALRSDVPRDLETICLKCLEKDPTQRYASALALAEDLRHFLADEPITARRPGLAERAARWSRRHGAAAVVAVIAVAVVSLIGAGAAGWALQARAQARAEVETVQADLDAERVQTGDLERRAATAEEEAAREAQRHQEAVTAILAQAESGELGRRPEGLEDAVFELLRHPEAQTSPLLVEALESLTRDMLAVEWELLQTAVEVTPLEAQAGMLTIERLPWAWEQQVSLLGESLSEEADRVLGEATHRLVIRSAGLAEAGRHGLHSGYTQLLEGRLRREIGSGRLDVARLACEALGRLEPREAVVEALARYLTAERSEERAIAPALALCRLGGELAAKTLLVNRLRFAMGGLFLSRLDPYLRLSELEVPLPEGDPLALVQRAEFLLNQGRFDEAVLGCTQALAIDPNNTSAYYIRGNGQRQRGRLAEAMSDFDEALALEPELGMVYIDRGRLRLQLGDLDGARQDLDDAVRFDPANSLGWTFRADVRRLQGEPLGALADCEAALRLDATNPIAYHLQGVCRAAQGNMQGALASLGRAVELAPLDAGMWADRGGLHQELGDLPSALSDMNKSVDLAPDVPEFRAPRGIVRAGLGDSQGALDDFERLAAAFPMDPGFRILCGQALLDLGRPAEAAESFKLALERSTPGDPFWNDAQAMLNHLEQAASSGDGE